MRAHLLTHLRTTAQQYNLPPFPARIAYAGNRTDLLTHFQGLDESVRDMVQSDLDLIFIWTRRFAGWSCRSPAAARGMTRRCTTGCGSVPRGWAEVLSLVMLYEIHEVGRFARVQDFLSYARLVHSKKTSAGKPAGGSGGKKIGNAPEVGL